MAREKNWGPVGVENAPRYEAPRTGSRTGGGAPRVEENPFQSADMRTAFDQGGADPEYGTVAADLRALSRASREREVPRAKPAPEAAPSAAPSLEIVPVPGAGTTREHELARWEAMKADAAANDAAQVSARERVRTFGTLTVERPGEQARNVTVGRPKGVWNWVKANAGFGRVFLLDEHGRPMDETEGFYQIQTKDGRLVGKKMENGKRIEVPIDWQTGRDARSVREHLKNAGHIVDRYGVGGR